MARYGLETVASDWLRGTYGRRQGPAPCAEVTTLLITGFGAGFGAYHTFVEEIDIRVGTIKERYESEIRVEPMRSDDLETQFAVAKQEQAFLALIPPLLIRYIRLSLFARGGEGTRVAALSRACRFRRTRNQLPPADECARRQCISTSTFKSRWISANREV